MIYFISILLYLTCLHLFFFFICINSCRCHWLFLLQGGKSRLFSHLLPWWMVLFLCIIDEDIFLIIATLTELADLPVITGSDTGPARLQILTLSLRVFIFSLLVVIYKNSLSDRRRNQQLFLDRVTRSAVVRGRWTLLIPSKTLPGESQGWFPFFI